MAEPVNLFIRLNPTRYRMARSMRRLFQIIAASDAKLYAKDPPRAFLPIFPTDDMALQTAITTVNDRLFVVTVLRR